jgi:hypothetical protein
VSNGGESRPNKGTACLKIDACFPERPARDGSSPLERMRWGIVAMR